MEAIQRGIETFHFEILHIKNIDIKDFKESTIYSILEKRLYLANIYYDLNTENKEMCISEIHFLNNLIKQYLGL